MESLTENNSLNSGMQEDIITGSFAQEGAEEGVAEQNDLADRVRNLDTYAIFYSSVSFLTLVVSFHIVCHVITIC